MSEFPKAFAVSSKDKKVLFNSSSGGVFYGIASYYINEYHGSVYGVAVSGREIVHKRITTIDELPDLMKSKYVKSDLKNTFNECLNDLQNGLKVFYVGLPCQIAGLISFLEYMKVDRTNLLTADLICHGAPEKKYWEAYLIDKCHSHTIIDVDFRYKKPSWENYSFKLDTVNGTFVNSFLENEYLQTFLNNYLLGEACYNCKFKGENRKSDLTFGDFWNCNVFYPEFYNRNGVTLVILRNHAKEFELKRMLTGFALNQVDYLLALKFNPSYFLNPKKPMDKLEFDSAVKQNGFLAAAKNFTHKKNRKQAKSHNFQSFKNLLVKKQKKLVNFKSKTIGIITDKGYFNYGNRLQNFSLTNFIRLNGYQSVNIEFDSSQKYHFSWIKSLLLYFKKILKDYDTFKKEKNIKKACQKTKEQKFIFFNSNQCIEKVNSLYSLILGSDQIWNWQYHVIDLPFNLGYFFNCVPKFSYAASLGIDFISDQDEKLYDKCLGELASIGVREFEAKRILDNKFNVSCEVNVDPVFLLNANEWNKYIIAYSKKTEKEKKYVLKYLLGECETNLNYNENEIIDLNSSKSKRKYNQFDFVKLIRDSDLIITNSFHAIAFSVIFGKKIFYIERKGMESRIKSLFSLLDIDYKKDSIIDFSECNHAKLDDLIIDSKKFLLDNFMRIENGK